MTTYAPLPLSRRPFGSLDGARLRNLQNTKNCQNALPPSLSSPIKRRYSPSDTLLEDAENIDPSLMSTKRMKNVDSSKVMSSLAWNLTAPSDESHFILTDATPSLDDLTSPIKPSFSPTIKRPMAKATSRLKRAGISGNDAHEKRSIASTSKSTSSPISLPIAGRSPKSKRIGILNKRRMASAFTRIDPPAKVQTSTPLSIDAALSGTIPKYSAKTRLPSPPTRPSTSLDEKPMKDGWFFEIHEDTPDETLTNLMEFSTGVLDISDDEDRRREKDDRGKENIPPAAEAIGSEHNIASVVTQPTPEPVSVAVNAPLKERQAKRTQTFTCRAPLSDLPASDFYDESLLDGASFNLNEPKMTHEDLALTAPVKADKEWSSVPLSPALNTEPEAISARGAHPQESHLSIDISEGLDCGDAEDKGFHIWESESAAGDVPTEL